MTTDRDEIIGKGLTLFLKRYSPPRNMQGDDEACQAEANAMFDALNKIGPTQRTQEWMDATLERMDMRMKSRAWPMVSEIREVAKEVANEMRPPRQEVRDETGPRSAGEAYQEELARYGRRMKSGLSVSEHCVFGRVAADLVGYGHVTRELRDQYRKAIFEADRQRGGMDHAKKREAELLEQHEQGKRLADAERAGAARDRQRPDVQPNRGGRGPVPDHEMLDG